MIVLAKMILVIIMHNDSALISDLSDRYTLVPSLKLFPPEVFLAIHQLFTPVLNFVLAHSLLLNNFLDSLIVYLGGLLFEIAVLECPLERRVLLVSME